VPPIEIGPAPILAVIVGTFHTCLYILLRGTASGRLLPMLLVAVLGAYAGHALGLRIGDPLRVGDFGLVWSSVFAWAGICVVAVVSQLAPARDRA
jgi:hypothetical protein